MEVVTTKSASLSISAEELSSGEKLHDIVSNKLAVLHNGRCDGVCFIIEVGDIISCTQPHLTSDSGDGAGFVTVKFRAKTLIYGNNYLAYAPVQKIEVASQFVCETPSTVFVCIGRTELLTGSAAHQAKFANLHLPLVVDKSAYVVSRKAQCTVKLLGAAPSEIISWNSVDVTADQRAYIAERAAAIAALPKVNPHAAKLLETFGRAPASGTPIMDYIPGALKAAKPGCVEMILRPAGPMLRDAARPPAATSPYTLGYSMCHAAEYAHMCALFCQSVSEVITSDELYKAHK